MNRLLTAIAIGCAAGLGQAAAQVEVWQLGGEGGRPWSEFTNENVLADDFTNPAVLQPRELLPDVNILPQLGPWHTVKHPPDFRYRDGQPRIWRGINYVFKRLFFPGKYVDGDPNTADVSNDLAPWRIDWEFYTIDAGGPIPAERFRFYPPEGIDHVSDVPYRPNFNPVGFQLSATNDPETLFLETTQTNEGKPGDYMPLDVVLFTTRQHYEPTGVIDIDFPLQFFRFFRIRAFPDDPGICPPSHGGRCIRRLAWAEMEVYGRGFVPAAKWESQVVDLGGDFNFGRVIFGVGKWRRDRRGELVPAPESAAKVEVELRTGGDLNPIAYFGFNSRGGHVEVTPEEYEALRVVRPERDPELIGWRGPVTHDSDNWGFWSAPLRESGLRPRTGKGRYFQLRVRLQSEEVWEFLRLDSLAVEISPLLADEVVGEIAALDNLRPEGNLTRVRAGVATEFLYDIRAEFSGDKKGFDAVRLITPSEADFLGLEMGDPLVEVEPEEVIAEPGGFTVHLPRRVSDSGQPLRIRLESALYGASGTFGGEVFDRRSGDLPQTIQSGDVSEEIGTDRLQVVAVSGSFGEVLGPVAVEPQTFTPQGDGINDRVRIGYTMLRVQGEVEVEVDIFALGGERVWRRDSLTQSAGRHTIVWDGRNGKDELVAPGLYLTRIRVSTSERDFERQRLVAVAY